MFREKERDAERQSHYYYDTARDTHALLARLNCTAKAKHRAQYRAQHARNGWSFATREETERRERRERRDGGDRTRETTFMRSVIFYLVRIVLYLVLRVLHIIIIISLSL